MAHPDVPVHALGAITFDVTYGTVHLVRRPIQTRVHVVLDQLRWTVLVADGACDLLSFVGIVVQRSGASFVRDRVGSVG